MRKKLSYFISIRFLLPILAISFLACAGNNTADDPSDECLMLQQSLIDATNVMQDALQAYVQDTENNALCVNYADALSDRIEKAQAMIDAGCLSTGGLLGTEQAIEEAQDELTRLGGC